MWGRLLAILCAAMALDAVFRFRARARMNALDQVRLLERERLARDLHDIVAHHVSAIAIRAQAGLETSASRRSLIPWGPLACCSAAPRWVVLPAM